MACSMGEIESALQTLTLALSRYAVEGTRLCGCAGSVPSPTQWERDRVRVRGSVVGA